VKRTEQILLIEGALVILGFLFFVFLKLRNPKSSQFKDDLWKEDPKIASHLDEVVKEAEKPPLALKGPAPKVAKQGPSQPNFNGAPHEVLGLKPNPHPEEVKAAHRHWIKRYHPDKVTHLGKEYVRQALHRAEQLNRARSALLDRKAAK
jgi:DnaJ-domain-containing protein 1